MIIAAAPLKEAVAKINPRLGFVNEDKMLGGLSFASIKELAGNSAGWFLQQFLKMGFARVAKSKFYMSMDSDSILIAPLVLDLNRPILNTLPVHLGRNHPFANTARDLLGLELKDDSFMCEIFLFSSEVMRALLDEFESKGAVERLRKLKAKYGAQSNFDSTSQPFYKNIIECVQLDRARYSFSEFETYGAFALKHPLYTQAYLPIFKHGAEYFEDTPELDDPLLRALASKYFIIGVNHYHALVPFARYLNALYPMLGVHNLMRFYTYIYTPFKTHFNKGAKQ